MKVLSIALSVVVVIILSINTAPAMAQTATGEDAALIPASSFPYDAIGESYVPSLYFTMHQCEGERLVAVPKFPYNTCYLSYTPSLYYEAWKIRAVHAIK